MHKLLVISSRSQQHMGWSRQTVEEEEEKEEEEEEE